MELFSDASLELELNGPDGAHQTNDHLSRVGLKQNETEVRRGVQIGIRLD
jgi:hypothetical protein